ncbi:hypothetical protein niasHS_005040 [Heterodera schachtii]|uniref:B30.2/SPRY domain-containing protein n=1 Tax=Heterodera schachtii TaxID=97005 RepID=A0ABD2JKI6_HETSC
MSKRRRNAFFPSSFGGEDIGQTEGSSGGGPSLADHQQQQTKLHEKYAKMEMEFNVIKLELENRALKAELKQKEMIDELKALKKKMAKMEEQKEAAEERFSQFQNDQKKIMEKISELEKQRRQQQNENMNKVIFDQFSQLKNDQKTLFAKVSELEKEHEQRKMLLNFRKNCWDATICPEEIEIIGDKNLIVNHKGKGRRPVFAKHPISLDNSSDIFYFEITVLKKIGDSTFGFAFKPEQTRLGEPTYAYENNGSLKATFINGTFTFPQRINAKYSYGVGDTVGIGVICANRQIIFTKNGQRLDSSDFFVAPSFGGKLFPFVSLVHSGAEIEANFGPNFQFDLTTL